MSSQPFRRGFRTYGSAVAAAAFAMLAGCDDRERLTSPGQNTGIGPVTNIISPSQDTVVRPGPGVFVTGRSTDPDGVDTLYVLLGGTSESFPPFLGTGDTVRFSLPISTIGRDSQAVDVLIFATDRLGNRGDSAIRRLSIRR